MDKTFQRLLGLQRHAQVTGPSAFHSNTATNINNIQVERHLIRLERDLTQETAGESDVSPNASTAVLTR